MVTLAFWIMNAAVENTGGVSTVAVLVMAVSPRMRKRRPLLVNPRTFTCSE